MVPSWTNGWQWCNWKVSCLERVQIFGNMSISNAPVLSSKSEHKVWGALHWMPWPCFEISAISFIRGISSLIAVERATYFASVVLRLISTCNVDVQIRWQLAYVMIKPVCERAMTELNWASGLNQLPVKWASAQHSNKWSLWSRIRSLSFVTSKYITNWLTSLVCDCLRYAENSAHWCTD